MLSFLSKTNTHSTDKPFLIMSADGPKEKLARLFGNLFQHHPDLVTKIDDIPEWTNVGTMMRHDLNKIN